MQVRSTLRQYVRDWADEAKNVLGQGMAHVMDVVVPADLSIDMLYHGRRRGSPNVMNAILLCSSASKSCTQLVKHGPGCVHHSITSCTIPCHPWTLAHGGMYLQAASKGTGPRFWLVPFAIRSLPPRCLNLACYRVHGARGGAERSAEGAARDRGCRRIGLGVTTGR